MTGPLTTTDLENLGLWPHPREIGWQHADGTVSVLHVYADQQTGATCTTPMAAKHSRKGPAEMLTTDPARHLLTEIRLDWDTGDRWGSVMVAMFGVADALHWIDPEAVPADWEYRPSMAGVDLSSDEQWEARAYLEAVGVDPDTENSNATYLYAAEALIRVGNVLGRLANVYRTKGWDY